MNNHMHQQLLEFMFSPGKYIDQSWLVNMEIDKIYDEKILGEYRANLLSEYLLDDVKINQDEIIQIMQSTGLAKQIMLLNADKTQQLIIYTGMLLCYNFLKKLIIKSEVNSITNRFGQSAYLFSLKKAPLIIQKNKSYFPEHNAFDDINDSIVIYGLSYINTFFKHYSEDIKQRIQWKIPYSWVKHSSMEKVNMGNFIDENKDPKDEILTMTTREVG